MNDTGVAQICFAPQAVLEEWSPCVYVYVTRLFISQAVLEEQSQNMPRVVIDMGFQPFDTFVARANQLCESLAACHTSFVTGPVGCGKTSLIQVSAPNPSTLKSEP